METQIIKYQYNGQEVEFDLENKNVMVNATEMAKIFDAQVVVFLRNEGTKNFINSCIKSENSHFISIKKEEDLVISRQKSGTWMHRILALKFAAWLNSDFELWVYSTIDDLLFGEAIARKELLSESIRLKREIFELDEKLKSNEDYVELVNKKAELLRLGKDLKANDDAESEKQLKLL